MPEVSVVIPTRNRRRLLAASLQSALWQQGVVLDVIVADDGSTDDTAALVTRLGDPRVRLLRQDRSAGVSSARNRGIEEATGEWIAFLDDDDLWAPDKLVSQLDAARTEGCSWAYAGKVDIDGAARILSGSPPPQPADVVSSLARYNAVPGGASSVVVQRDLLAKTGLFDTRLRHSEDWDMWIRLASTGMPAWVCSPHVGVRIHPGNASRGMARALEEMDIIAERYGLSVDRPRHFRWAAWVRLTEGRRREALRYYMRATVMGDMGSAVRMLAALIGWPRPRYGSRPDGRANSSTGWLDRAQVWLEQFRGTQG